MTDYSTSTVADVAAILSSSHKRMGCSSATFGTAPEPKRSMLFLENSTDFKNTDEQKLLPVDVLDPILETDTNRIVNILKSDRGCYNVQDETNENCTCETGCRDEDKFPYRHSIFNCNKCGSCRIACSPAILPFVAQDEKDEEKNESNCIESDYRNIADTSDYIGSLLNIMSGGENSFNESWLSNELVDSSTKEEEEIEGNLKEGEALDDNIFENDDNKKRMDDFLSYENHLISSSSSSALPLSIDSVKEIAAEIHSGEDEDDLLLSNLPTSVDDFQAKEFHLKLERHLSSPRFVHNNSEFQSPKTVPNSASNSKCDAMDVFYFDHDTPLHSAVDTYDQHTGATPDLNGVLLCEASTSNNAHSCCGLVPAPSTTPNFSSALGSLSRLKLQKSVGSARAFSGSTCEFSPMNSSRTLSNASESIFDADLDDNDLEVAMINESFEEQQKQSKIYEGLNLKSVFYGISSSSKSQEQDPVEELSQHYYNESPFDPTQPSTSSMGMHADYHQHATNYISSAETDTDDMTEELEENNKNDMLDEICESNDDLVCDLEGKNANDDGENERSEESLSGSTTSPIKANTNFFVPLLTPKSRQFVLQQGKSFTRTGKYRIPTIATIEDKDTDTEFPNGYPLLNPQLFKRNNAAPNIAVASSSDFSAANSHLDICLKEMMLSEEKDLSAFWKCQDEETEEANRAMFNSKLDTECTDLDLNLYSGMSVPSVNIASCWSHPFLFMDNKNDERGCFAANDFVANNNLSTNNKAIFLSKSPETLSQINMCAGYGEKFSFYTNSGVLESNDIIKSKEESDEFLDDSAAKMVAYNVVRSVFESPLPTDENILASSTPKKETLSFFAKDGKCDGGFRNKGDSFMASENECEAECEDDGSDGDDLARVAEEAGSVELSASDFVDSSADLAQPIVSQPIMFDDNNNSFDEAEKFKGLNLNSSTVGSAESDNNESVLEHHTKQITLSGPSSHDVALSHLVVSSSSSSSSFSFLDGKSSEKSDMYSDEQAVPVLDSWEHLDDDEDLASRMLDEAKTVLAKANAKKNAAAILEGKRSASLGATIDKNFDGFAHVIEASYQGVAKLESDVLDAIFFLAESSADVFHKKVDAKHFLVVFPSAEKAADALFTKQAITFLCLKALENASPASQSFAMTQKAQLTPKKKRPVTTATVARRMIANSLNIRIDVPQAQRQKEAQQLAEAKESKRQKESIWEN